MSENSQSAAGSASVSGPVDQDVLSGDACVKCGFKCIEGCT
jgi:hypothetical protein